MTHSAEADDREADRLERTLELYRDLSLALRDRIAALRADADTSGEPKGIGDLVRSHQKSLQSVLDLEVSLGRRAKAGGGGVELDLDAARAEIRARLARLADR